MPKTGILIEWLAFLLTAIAWIVFISLRMRNTSAEASREAGETLRKWTGGYNKWVIAGSVVVLAMFALSAFSPVFLFASPDFATLGIMLNITALCVFLFPQRESLEICTNGMVIYRNGKRIFIPWKKMEYVRISSATGKVFAEEPHWRRDPYRIPLTDVPAAIDVLRPLVVIRDADGRLLNPEFNPNAVNASAEPDRRKWQFSLRSVLLFFVLASCTMSWYSIHYRKEQARAKLLAEMGARKPFPPFTDGTRLVFLSAAQYGDKEMKLAAQWPDLAELDVSGSSVTDAGLESLYDVQSLRRLNLRGAKVTVVGVRKLRRQLPKCEIVSSFTDD